MTELDRLIFQGENDQVDFKRKITSPDKIARTLVSFANTRGGTILIGVNDDGRVSGIDPDEEKHMIELAAGFYCDPPVPVQFEEIDLDNGTVLRVTISESQHKPHYAKVKEDDWRGYVRVKDTSVQTSRLVEKTMRAEEPEPAPPPLENHENTLLDYLRKHNKVTLKQYMKLANLSRRRAYRTLIKLVIHGYLRLHDKEKEDYYTLI